jgi:outer membrane protein OmpA-like peptidoglycan-associated protein
MKTQRHATAARTWLLSGLVMIGGVPHCAAAAEPSSGGTSTAVLSEQQIEQMLKGAPAPATTRGLRRQVTPEVPASISLNIPFEYNSFALKPEASEQLKQLSSALNSQSLRGDRFMVAGHTDAKGNPQSNKRLSLHRAESVQHFLVAHGVDVGRIDAVGYGSEQLLDPDQPGDSRNRRVEIRDLGAAH